MAVSAKVVDAAHLITIRVLDHHSEIAHAPISEWGSSALILGWLFGVIDNQNLYGLCLRLEFQT